MAQKGPTHQQMIEERRRRREEAEALARAKEKKKTMWTVCGVIGTVLLLALMIVLIMQPWADKVTTTAGNGNDSSAPSASDFGADWEFKHDMEVKHHAEITVKDYGVIKLELDPTYAPITVDNFLTLAESGFYDGLTFHRIIEGFMIQGGAPNKNSSNVANIKGEFKANGVTNPLLHERGVISMARASDVNSASSQFFIVQKDSPHLNGSYAAFGVVTEGMEVVDAIAGDAKPTDNNGTIPEEEQPVIESVRIID